MIPLGVPAVDTIWRRLKPFDFDTSHGAFASMTVRDEELKERLRMSCETVIRKLINQMIWAGRGLEDMGEYFELTPEDDEEDEVDETEGGWSRREAWSVGGGKGGV